MSEISKFFSGLKNKRVGFIGAGVSHRELIEMFLEKGISCAVLDKKTKEEFDNDTYESLLKKGAEFCLGEKYLDEMKNFDIVFRTPGMYFYNGKINEARENGTVITSEMEVFFDLCPCKIYAVTGTDGKTTTTTIISKMLESEGKRVHLGGNIGRALLPVIEDINEDDIAVVELSSFQLISMRKSPDVAVITNIYPDHLNVHSSMEEYISAKTNLIAHQNAFSKTVLNMDNKDTDALSPLVRGNLLKFSTKAVPQRGAYLDNEGWLCFANGKTSEKLFNKSEIKIPGMHNVENYLAAISAVRGEVSAEKMLETAKTFGGVEHRIEFVREKDGVKYYNDSIATSPVSVIAGLNAFSQKLIVIAGGSDKNLDYNQLAKPLTEHVKVLVLLGATADKIEKAVKDCKDFDEACLKIIRVNSMEEAVSAAQSLAESGDVITLSPASASFDMYQNFEERGRHYKAVVNSL